MCGSEPAMADIEAKQREYGEIPGPIKLLKD